jgi:DNA-binding MarR family transcriptional regulator
MIRRITLATLLRHLVQLLDGAVEDAYRSKGLDYRPRYTPLIRVLMDAGPSSLRSISDRTGVTHSAISQTVSQMVKARLVRLVKSSDGRERVVVLTPQAKRILPQIVRQWRVTQAAARALEAEVGVPLADVIARTLAALTQRSFADRIADAGKRLPEIDDNKD